MEIFNELGSQVEDLWAGKNYDLTEFPEVAAEALAGANLPGRLDAWEVVRWIHSADRLPAQNLESEFGNPPVTVYRSSRFYIEVYFWLDGTTAIHQHAFAGAFQVLSGASLHSNYSFAVGECVSPHLLTGRTQLQGVELLQIGDVRPIRPGSQFIHSLFHLDRPSATITIRTSYLPEELPQYYYLKPSLALNPADQSPLATRRAQTASLLLSARHPDAKEIIRTGLLGDDFLTAFKVLEAVFEQSSRYDLGSLLGTHESWSFFDELIAAARTRFGSRADLLPPVFAEMDRQQQIIKRRGWVTDPNHRYLLSLLLNVPDHQTILRLIEQRFPGPEPVTTAIHWVEELSHTKVLGSPEPNVLGVEGFDETYLSVYEALLKGRSIPEIAASFAEEAVDHKNRPNVAAIVQVLKNSILGPSIPDQLCSRDA